MDVFIFFALSSKLYELKRLQIPNAEIYMNDPEDVKERKMNKVILLRTTFAVLGFMIAILTIVIGTFVDDIDQK